MNLDTYEAAEYSEKTVTRSHAANLNVRKGCRTKRRKAKKGAISQTCKIAASYFTQL